MRIRSKSLLPKGFGIYCGPIRLENIINTHSSNLACSTDMVNATVTADPFLTLTGVYDHCPLLIEVGGPQQFAQKTVEFRPMTLCGPPVARSSFVSVSVSQFVTGFTPWTRVSEDETCQEGHGVNCDAICTGTVCALRHAQDS